MAEIFQVPAVITGDKSLLNGSRRFIVETQENMSPDDMRTLIDLENKVGWFTFSVRRIEAADIAKLPEPNADEYVQGKTQAQRLRAVIYILWTQKGKPGEFDDFYKKKMEIIIEQLKEKLE